MARKLLLPRFELTELSDEGDTAARRVEVLDATYYVRPKLVPDEGKHQFNIYPVILDSEGVPWAEANGYLLSRLEWVLNPVMSTYAGVADDLAAHRRFLDEHDIDWTEFPAQKLSRPTYRFNGHLKFAISAGEMAAATTKRRRSTVFNFYCWLGGEGVFTPANPAWKESDHYVQFQNAQGFQQSKKVTTTDVELMQGAPAMRLLVEAFPRVIEVAAGRKSELLLGQMGVVTAGQVRHPANGGATAFALGLAALAGQVGLAI